MPDLTSGITMSYKLYLKNDHRVRDQLTTLNYT